MPIQIIPKEAAKLPLWQNIMFYFSIGLVLSILGSYGILYHFTKKAVEDFNNIDKAIIQGKTEQILTLENEMKSYRDKIDDFASLINNHKFSYNFFGKLEDKIGVLEKNTHPKVFFNEMNFNVTGNSVVMSGTTESFEIIGQQIFLFQNDPDVKSVKISKAEINKEGKIDFNLDILLDPTLFQNLISLK